MYFRHTGSFFDMASRFLIPEVFLQSNNRTQSVWLWAGGLLTLFFIMNNYCKKGQIKFPSLALSKIRNTLRSMIKITVFAGFTFFVNCLFGQTCVIAIKTNNAIYVGADSREVFTKTNPITNKLYDSLGSICKLYHIGNFNFASLGQEIDEEIKMATIICRDKKSFDEVAESFGKMFGSYLGLYLQYQKTHDSNSYYKLIKEKPFISQTMFFGYENDSAVLADVLFQVPDTIKDFIIIRHSIVKRDLLYGGFVEEIRGTIEKGTTWKNGTVQTIKKLIQIEMAAHPKEVGGDINMLIVTPDKQIEWIPRQNSCLIHQKS
jgi:hypothetical protein